MLSLRYRFYGFFAALTTSITVIARGYSVTSGFGRPQRRTSLGMRGCDLWSPNFTDLRTAVSAHAKNNLPAEQRKMVATFSEDETPVPYQESGTSGLEEQREFMARLQNTPEKALRTSQYGRLMVV
ncbi:hypothetical protein PFLUV_G00119380 [Perca fluviatilis]|uniref:Uncharacterized protein n=1 Tax=Perca fluviatilis TaxID=8168 RepID=A0A6A5F287_PERFL|nr:hypothetical protein PFLUV_G00119380 [Perca fluviatilis]